MEEKTSSLLLDITMWPGVSQESNESGNGLER